VLNIPLVKDKLAVRAVGYADSSGGWSDDPSRGLSNINRVNRAGGRIDLRWKPGGGDWTLDTSLVAQDLRARDTQYATNGLSHDTALAEPHHNRFLLVRFEARGPLAGLDFLSSTAIENNRVDSRFDASAVAAQRGTASPLAYDERRNVYLISQEFRLTDPRDAHKWVVGVSIIDTINIIKSWFVPPTGALLPARSLANERLEAAAFGEAVQSLGSGFDFTLGLRAFTSQSLNDPREPISKAKPSIGFTPSATLSWHPSSRQLFWLRYASAIRPGGLTQDESGTPVTFKSDDLKSLELGSRLTLLDDHLVLNMAAFALDWRNLQSDQIDLNGLVTTVNIDDATNYGAEFDARVKWSDFTLEASLTRQHGRLRTPNPTTGIRPRLPVLPDISARGRLAWDSRVGTFDVGAHLSVNFWGDTQLGFDPAFPQNVPSRVIMGAGAMIGRDNWRLSLSISNLMNSRSDTFAFGNPFTFRITPQSTPTQPRTIGIRFERRF
jgi:outer membrane receptor protein involved in Fe transport